MLGRDVLPANLLAERWAHIFRMMTDHSIWLSVSVSVSFFKTQEPERAAVKTHRGWAPPLTRACPDEPPLFIYFYKVLAWVMGTCGGFLLFLLWVLCVIHAAPILSLVAELRTDTVSP